jgi:hypothetical protein
VGHRLRRGEPLQDRGDLYSARNFLAKLPDSEHLQEEIAYALEWYATKQDYFSDRNDRERDDQGAPETLRYLGAPDWFIRCAMWLIRRRWARASG